MYIAEQITRLRNELPEGVNLLAISKYQPIEALQEAYDAGQRMFGENHIQEMASKAAVLPKDIAWHFTGHVQTNKIKYMASFVSLIHAVDSFRLLREINKHAAKHERVITILVLCSGCTRAYTPIFWNSFWKVSSSISSSCAPVIACVFSFKIPNSLAIAIAVSI